MLELTLSRVLWLVFGCLLAVTARVFWLVFFPNSHLPFALGNDSVLVWLWSGANFLLFIEFVLFAGSLSLYNRERSGDLMPGWVLWSMALALIFLAAASAVAVVVPFVPAYRIWVLFIGLTAISMGVSMAGYPLAMRRLARRRSMTELEATIESLRISQIESAEQREAISKARSTLARVSLQIDSAMSRADSIAGDMELLALSLEAVEVRESKIYERISDANSNLAQAQWSNGAT